MNVRALCTALVIAGLVGCENSPSAPVAARVFAAVGAYATPHWYDASVPGSLTPRAGTQLPLYFVCPVEGDTAARAAAVLSDAQLRLHNDGTAEITLLVGTWMRSGAVVISSAETISRYGEWEEAETGLVTLSGFGIPGLGDTMQYTALGSAELPMTLTCPAASSVSSVQPTLSFSLAQ